VKGGGDCAGGLAINMSDLLLISGRYGIDEAASIVGRKAWPRRGAGSGVRHLKEGDRTLVPIRPGVGGTDQGGCEPAAALAGGNIHQLAMLGINPRQPICC